MSVTINRKLNLVVPVEVHEGVTVYFHSAPVMNETFETYYKVMAKAFTEIYTSGLSYVSGPRVAAMALKDVSVKMGVWDGPEGVENGLLGEIKRLTNVVMLGDRGWQVIPVADKAVTNVVSEDDFSEVNNAIAFFILASAMHKKSQLKGVLEGAAALWGASVMSLNATEYAASLPTSTTAASTGEKVTRSSIPS